MLRVRMLPLVAWLTFTAIITLGPFNFGVAPPETGFLVFRGDSHQHEPTHLLLNVLLFVPLGAFVYHDQQGTLRLLTIVTLVGVAAFLFSFVLEALQRFLPGRESSLADLAANTAGGVVGVFGSRAFGAQVTTWLDDIRVSKSSAVLSLSLACFTALALLISGALQNRTRLSNWSHDYPLLIGNEATGDRPWMGRVFELVITDAATSRASARQFAGGESIAVPGARIGAFDFTESAPYRDSARNLPDLNWTHIPLEAGGSSNATTVDPWLQSNQAASRIVQRLEATNAFTIRIKCATNNGNQAGPARIVSNSASALARNFTLGQNGSDLVIRLRTPLTGLNGHPLETIVPHVFTTEEPRDILVTYDGTSLIAAVARTNQLVRTELTPGLGAALALAPESVDLTHQQIYKLSYLVALFLIPGMLIALLGRTSVHRLVFSTVYAVSAGIAIEATIVLASGRTFDWMNASMSAGLAAVVLTVLGVAALYDAPSTRMHEAQVIAKRSQG